MRKFLWGFALALMASIVFLACQKEVSSPEKQYTTFDDKAAKEWYYGTFKKSVDWQGSSEKGTKLPDWKHPLRAKIGKNELVEFPLIKKNSSYPISANNQGKTLTTDEIKRIANASISRIVFIKNPSGQLAIREVDYIPDWNYLQRKGFDISSIDIQSASNDYSGRIIVKKWNGEIVSMAMLENGKIIKRGVKSNTLQKNKEQANGLTETEQCFEQQFCIWQQDCVVQIYGDGMMIQECTSWYNTGECWMEYWCEEGGDPCELYGMGCGDPEEPDEEISKSADMEWDVFFVPQSAGGGLVLSTDRFFGKFKPNNPQDNRFTSGVHLNNRMVGNDGNFVCGTWGVTVNSNAQATTVCGGRITFLDGTFLDISNTKVVHFSSLNWQ